MMKVVLPEFMFTLTAFDLEFFEGCTGSLYVLMIALVQNQKHKNLMKMSLL